MVHEVFDYGAQSVNPKMKKKPAIEEAEKKEAAESKKGNGEA